MITATDQNEITLEGQLIENVGYDEEIRIRLGDLGLVVTRIHIRDGIRMEMKRVFTKVDYDQLQYTHGEQLAKTLWNMAIELRTVRTNIVASA